MSATDLGVLSANGPADFCQPGGEQPIRLAKRAVKIIDFSEPKPGKSIRRLYRVSPESELAQSVSASPS